MRKFVFLSLLLLLLFVSFYRDTSAERPLNISMIQLIANPENFDGKFIQVSGFLRLEFEGNGLYLHKEDYENWLSKNGIWINLPDSLNKQAEKCHLNYVIIEGIFDADSKGHMDGWSGEIRDINRIFNLSELIKNYSKNKTEEKK